MQYILFCCNAYVKHKATKSKAKNITTKIQDLQTKDYINAGA